jgi:hypothetical protein
MEVSRKVKELIAEHRELQKLIPLHKLKPSKRVAKSELWSRSDKEELSRMAEEFLKSKNGSHSEAEE